MFHTWLPWKIKKKAQFVELVDFYVLSTCTMASFNYQSDELEEAAGGRWAVADFVATTQRPSMESTLRAQK